MTILRKPRDSHRPPRDSRPRVGDKVTFCVGSDMYPASVTRVSQCAKTVHIVEHDFEARQGNDIRGEQKWKVLGPNGCVHKLTWRKDKERYIKAYWDTGMVHFGVWDPYIDPTF